MTPQQVEQLRALDLNLAPCKAKSKLPSIPWKEYQTKKYVGEITETQNAAVICGESSGGLVVIDVDSPELINELFDDFESIKETTLVVKTGKGGYHIYVRPKEKVEGFRVTNDKLQHIDLQSNNTYVISPFSIHPNGNEYKVISKTMNINSIDIKGFIEGLSRFGFNRSDKKPISEIVKGVAKGDRDLSAFKYACHLLAKVELDAATALHELVRWNETNTPPLEKVQLVKCFNSALQRARPEPKPIKEVAENFKEFREIGAKDEGKMITFDCMIGAIDELKSVSTMLFTVCDKCGAKEDIDGEGFVNPKLPKCKNCKTPMVSNSSPETIDMRQVLLQELPGQNQDKLPIHFTGRVIGENTQKIKMGQRVRMKGRYKSICEKGSMDNKVVILINEIFPLDEPEETELTPEEIEMVKGEMKTNFMKRLTRSFCPQILGNDDAKEILLLTIAAGVKVGYVKRPDINTLLIGNPSKGKSELLLFVTKIMPKATYANGKSSSGVGLVYSMVKLSDGTSVPTPGIMITNSGGLVCLDEFDKMSDGARNELLQVMEQQTATLNKSGASNITAEAKTAVIAAANPKLGTWDKDLKVLENINLKSHALERFDWIVGLIETNSYLNAMIVDHIIGSFGEEQEKLLFDESMFRHYVNTVRNIQPTFTAEATKKIKDFYGKLMQRFESGYQLPMEVRQIHALFRASAAHAKLFLRDSVIESDADEVIRLYKKSCESLGLSFEGNQVQTLLEDKHAGRDSAVFKTWNLVEDEAGLISKDELKNKLLELYPRLFPDVYAFEKMWVNHDGKQFILQLNGKYRLSL